MFSVFQTSTSKLFIGYQQQPNLKQRWAMTDEKCHVQGVKSVSALTSNPKHRGHLFYEFS